MSDLIDRQKAIKYLERFIKDCNPDHFVGHPNFIEYMDSVGIQSFGNWQYANGFNMGLTAAEVAIKNLPTIEAEPVRQGRWIIKSNPENGWYKITCSECGEDETTVAPCIGFMPNVKVIWDFCPNCGARMDGGGDDADKSVRA